MKTKTIGFRISETDLARLDSIAKPDREGTRAKWLAEQIRRACQEKEEENLSPYEDIFRAWSSNTGIPVDRLRVGFVTKAELKKLKTLHCSVFEYWGKNISEPQLTAKEIMKEIDRKQKQPSHDK